MVGKVQMARVIAAFTEMIDQNGSQAQVTLKDGTQFCVMATDANMEGDSMTSGLQQGKNVVRVMHDAWHAQAGRDRPPYKGDQLLLAGRRYAVQDPRPAQFQNTIVGYVLRCKG